MVGSQRTHIVVSCCALFAYSLRHNVIKTGLRKISTSYSRIRFSDICAKLALETPQNAEFVCAKAIRDGVIDAVIDHKNGWLQSKETVNVYTTNDPQVAFQKRITFCLDVHNEAVKVRITLHFWLVGCVC